MAVSSKVFGQAQSGLASGEINFAAFTVKVMLCTSAYQPDQDAHRYRSHVTDEVTGPGYTPGGATLSGKAVSYDAASNTTKLTANNISWPNSTITARYAVFYVDSGQPQSSALLCYWDFGGDFASSAGSFDLTINAAGLLTFQTA